MYENVWFVKKFLKLIHSGFNFFQKFYKDPFQSKKILDLSESISWNNRSYHFIFSITINFGSKFKVSKSFMTHFNIFQLIFNTLQILKLQHVRFRKKFLEMIECKFLFSKKILYKLFSYRKIQLAPTASR